MVEDTSKQKKITHTNGNIESVMPNLNKENKVENKQKSPSKKTVASVENDYGYKGLIDTFNKLNINITDWITEQIYKQRGGITFMLPNAEGSIYLSWEDMYYVDVTFVNTKKKYKELVTIPTLEVLLLQLEEQRQRTVGSIRNMLKDAFKGEAPEGKPF
mgnify:CR=1 FL=1